MLHLWDKFLGERKYRLNCCFQIFHIFFATNNLALNRMISLYGIQKDYYIRFLLHCHTFFNWWATFWLVIYLICDWFGASLITANLAAYPHEQLVLIASIEVKEVWRACDRQINQEYHHQNYCHHFFLTKSVGSRYQSRLKINDGRKWSWI